MCGISMVVNHPAAASVVREAHLQMQGRGHDGFGITTADKNVLRTRRTLGLVHTLGVEDLENLPGRMAVGHNRYATSGERGVENNIQPLFQFLTCNPGLEIALGHNGNLTNQKELRAQCIKHGAQFKTTSDTELIIHLFAQTDQQLLLHERLIQALEKVEGAYSLVLLAPQGAIAAVDPHGFRPLVYGRLGEGIMFASEDAALTRVGATYKGAVEPGEIHVVAPDASVTLHHLSRKAPQTSCIFELIYFAWPGNEHVFGKSVYKVRKALGRALAHKCRTDAEIIIPVMDSGYPAALGYQQASSLPIEQGLVRSRYSTRSFTQPDHSNQVAVAQSKHPPLPEAVRGRRVLVVDDSLVRGTTTHEIVKSLRRVGATKVHVAIASPPVVAPCYYGIDTPTREELAVVKYGGEEGVRKFIDADSLTYLDRAEMLQAEGGSEAQTRFCTACFTGVYPTTVPT